MLSTWPIRKKLLFGIGLLLVLVATLSWSGFHGVYAYRGLVRSLSGRATELPLAAALSRQIGEIRVTASEIHGLREATNPGQPIDGNGHQALAEEFGKNLLAARESLGLYRDQLAQAEQDDEGDFRLIDSRDERQTVTKIEAALAHVGEITVDQQWPTNDAQVTAVNDDLDRLQALSAVLPSYLHQRIHLLAGQVRTKYRTLIVLTGITALSAGLMLALLIKLFYSWIFRPLGILIEGSRRVAGGEFGYRIQLSTHDEMAELAAAMNDMTARFQAIRDDLDRQVQQRTQQVVRSEQLASVGFLAAGVAHEINNPLASIAMCAESLESRLEEIFEVSGNQAQTEQAVVRNYLQMIQNEAFRCKGITERLLDFSRLGDLKRHDTELGQLVQGVIDMVGHLGKYHDKRIEFAAHQRVVAPVNAQELKQVVLNLITNALDSLSEGGTVRIELLERGERAEIVFSDDGCGMTDEVLEHLFEPFFTRRRTGQGTGLGLSIAYRIIGDHGGQIDVRSDGPGKGSQFRVSLPLAEQQKESQHRYQAA